MHRAIVHAAPSATPVLPRVDLYADIHKALRAAMCETLMAVGRTDADDADEVATALATVRDLLALCASHVDKENRYLHPAIEARSPGSSATIAAEHDDHLQAIADLEEDVRVVEAAPAATREAMLLRLHRHLSGFMAENFAHMLVEESAHNAALWASHSDAELIAIHDVLLASIAPAEMTSVLRWMVPSVTHASRVRVFGGMRAVMPPEAFDGTYHLVASYLRAADRAKLDRAMRANG